MVMSSSKTNSSVNSVEASVPHQPPSPSSAPKVPPAVSGIQYNFCKNNQCSQFGQIPSDLPNKRGAIGAYSFTAGGKKYPLLKCNACSESPPLKSNLGINHEINRISAYLKPKEMIACPNADCDNHTVALGTKKVYRSFGTTKGGAPRYQCALCHKTFSIPKPTQYQHDTHHNQMIFKMLVNKVPLNRIVAILGIHWEVLYNRIDFIHRQCLNFVADREARLKDLPIKRLYLSLDHQDHLVNWTERHDKRNVNLSCIASADNTTGYVFGIHPNFDMTVDREAVEADAMACGDTTLPLPHRKYAHFWLADDYAVAASKRARQRLLGGTLANQIADTYAESASRDDVEIFDDKTKEQKLPDYGMQVHAEYTMIAHFHFLKRLMGKVDKWRFFMDQDSGIRSAFLSAFIQEVKEHDAEGFYVRIAKELSVDAKRALLNQSNREFKQLMAQHPSLSENEVKLYILKQRIANMSVIDQWKDLWVQHPVPNMGEADKAMCWLTPHTEFDEDHIARLYNKASLHGIDAFFEKVRRRIAMLERPTHSSSSYGRTWSGYAAYNPGQVVKLLEIFRVVHNYIDTRKTNGVLSTPAMRLGLAKAPLDYGDVIYFQ
jgi:transposase-like protein